jgi:hypothetical protein
MAVRACLRKAVARSVNLLGSGSKAASPVRFPPTPADLRLLPLVAR